MTQAKTNGLKKGVSNMTVKPEEDLKWPFGCWLCRKDILRRYCLVCPPLSMTNSMTAEELRSMHRQMRYESEAKGIVSVISPESEKYFADLNKRLKKEQRQRKIKNFFNYFKVKLKGNRNN